MAERERPPRRGDSEADDVVAVLKELGLGPERRLIEVWNKTDALDDDTRAEVVARAHRAGAVAVSAMGGYILTRALPGGFLGDHGDVGNWHCPLGIAALSVESVIILLVLLAGLGAWHARIHAAWSADTSSPPPSRSRSAATAWPGTWPPTTSRSPPPPPPCPPRWRRC